MNSLIHPKPTSLRFLTASVLACCCLSQMTAAADPTNTAFGDIALDHVTTGGYDSAFGYAVMDNNTTGNYNTSIGALSLEYNIGGSYNTACGAYALSFNHADNNTAIGYQALVSNDSGMQNTAAGVGALKNNNGDSNTANGFDALLNNTTGVQNTATGALALQGNKTGGLNTADGYHALAGNTTGNYNTATGQEALYHNTTGSSNTAAGTNALFFNGVGHDNTASGFQTLYFSTGNNNIAIGSAAGSSLTTGSNNIDIGNSGKAGEANAIRIGKQGTQTATYIAGIYSKGVASASGINVKIDSTGKLGTVLSSARYKEAIKPMGKASESILHLEPVTFRYRKEFDSDGVTQFGLVAEAVENVDPSLVVRDEEGKPLTVRYDAVNAMLLNEFLKEHAKVEEQATALVQQGKDFRARLNKLESSVRRQQDEIKALIANMRPENRQTATAQLERAGAASSIAPNHEENDNTEQ